MTIIQPAAITQRATWNGSSAHPHDPSRTVQNLDSSMDWAEHQTIVFKALALLSSDTLPEIFKPLKSAYNDTVVEGRKTKIYVSKGIHQPETNPHLQIETESKPINPKATGAAFIRRYHLVVSAVDTVQMDDRFKWTGVQFSCSDEHNAVHAYPVGVVPQMKAPATTRSRRNSVSTADLSAHIKALEAAAAELAAVKSFDELCIAFETTNAIKPIDRAIRTVKVTGWTKPTYTGLAKTGPATLKFQYDALGSRLLIVK